MSRQLAGPGRPGAPRRMGFVVACLLLSLAACSRGPEGPGICELAVAGLPVADGDSIIEGVIGDASNLISMRAGDSSSHRISGLIFDGMLTYDKNLSGLEPRLAERWEVSEDGLQITFYLRKDVRWQDGEPFTARDVEFGFNTIIDPGTLTAYAEDYLQVEKFEVIDDYTFRATYAEPYAPALATWTNLVVLPRHILEGQDINEATEFARNPIGLGPYKFESWETQRQITVHANEGYYRGRPHIERVVTRVLPDQQTQFLELKSGGLDSMGLTPLQFTRQTSKPDFTRNIRKYNYLGSGYTYLGYNLLREPFTDVRVRRALTHAIDKNELVGGVLLGLGKPASTPYKPGRRWHNDEV
ncbi:MAG: ABC transporter substrate-binding protein, partial [Candidatus Binatia bacterium]